MVETLTASYEFEHQPHREIEQKFLPLFPEELEVFRESAQPIEQFYLSHPSEDFSLRLRQAVKAGELTYIATLKSRGQLTAAGLDRLEVEAPITAATYELYKQLDGPIIRKLRAEPMKNIAVDFFDDGQIVVESENPISLSAFTGRYGLSASLADVTGDHITDNEWRAAFNYRREHAGQSAWQPADSLDVNIVLDEVGRRASQNQLTIVAICGRSGSGKSTLVRQLNDGLAKQGLASLTLSTDDYHRGKTWLEHYQGGPWTDWDAPIVYDTSELVSDLARLRQRQEIVKRRFDFAREEPVFDGVVGPAPVVIIEGIYASNSDLAPDLRYDMPTPLATCIGRRLLRDLAERPQFAEPAKSLRYIIEKAEPAYQNQSRQAGFDKVNC